MARSKMKTQNDEYERLHAEFDRLYGDFLSLAEDVKSFAEHEERTRGKARSDRVVALRAVGGHQLELAKGYALDAAKTAGTTVREHPRYAFAGAAALAMLVGVFAVRRH